MSLAQNISIDIVFLDDLSNSCNYFVELFSHLIAFQKAVYPTNCQLELFSDIHMLLVDLLPWELQYLQGISKQLILISE